MLVELEGQLELNFPYRNLTGQSGIHQQKSLRKSTRCKADDEKRLLTAFGPLLCVGILVGVLFLGPWKINSHDPKVIAQAATAMNDVVFRGDRIKNEAIATGKYVPFLAHPN